MQKQNNIIYIDDYKSCNTCMYNGERGCVIIGIVKCGEKYNWALWNKGKK